MAFETREKGRQMNRAWTVTTPHLSAVTAAKVSSGEKMEGVKGCQGASDFHKTRKKAYKARHERAQL